MAIFQKAYRGYYGELTPLYQRPLVLFRYSMQAVISSRLFWAFMVAGLIPSFVVMCMIYLRYNLDLIMQFEIPIDELVRIDARFFAEYMLGPQLLFVFILIMASGPTLASPDMRNNALSLYLSRPISKTGYIVGKLLVLLVLGSCLSWIPGILLILFQSYMAGGEWFVQHLHLLPATLIASLIWIISLSLLALAISATVKVAPIARLSFFGIIFVASALGGIVRLIIGSWYGSLLSIFDAQDALIQFMYGIKNFSTMPIGASIFVFAVLVSLSLLVLYRRIRGLEVVA